MSRMKDLHIDLMNLEQAWIDFLADLFLAEGWEVLARDAGSRSRFEPDIALSQRGEQMVAELKLTRSGQVSRALMRNALANLAQIMKVRSADHGLLIIPQRLTRETWHEFHAGKAGEVELWDLDRLVERTTRRPELARRLAELLRALKIGAEKVPDSGSTIAILEDASEELPPIGEGTRLAEALQGIRPGNKKRSAQAFEELCEEALRLLFGTELIGWRRQSAIEQGYQRVDLIARLQPSRSAFWNTLATDFRARYIVFEFKNHAGPIGQDEIYATERYLYATALRSVAVIIARNGYTTNAKRTIQGALRDQGKLIICLDLEEFADMLRAYDAGDVYEKILLARRDDLLMSLAR